MANSQPSPRPTSSRRLSFTSFTPRLSSIRKGGRASNTFFEPGADSDTLSTATTSQEDPSFFSADESDSRPVSRASTIHTRSTSDPIRSSTASIHTNAHGHCVAWREKSLSKRISWGWNQTFAGLSPQTLEAISAQSVRPTQIEISSRPSTTTRTPSIASLGSRHSIASTTSQASTIVTPSVDKGKAAVDNRPFSSKTKFSLYNLERPRIAEPDPELFTVKEESRPATPRPTVQTTDLSEEPFDDSALDINNYEDDIDDMGLARSLTNRLRRSDSQSSVIRISSTRKPRPTISLPITLLSSTNEISYNAPDVPGLDRSPNIFASSSGPSTPSSEAPELTDTSSVGSRSSSEGSPTYRTSYGFAARNHLTPYFECADNKSPITATVEIMTTPSDSPTSSQTSSLISPTSISDAPPAIPTRAAFHSKREHVRLARARSVRSSASSGSLANSRHASLEAQKAAQLPELTEIQEDFNSILLEQQTLEMMEEAEVEKDRRWLEGEGYRAFTPSAYLDEIADVEGARFVEA